jgi:hypothetical protein
MTLLMFARLRQLTVVWHRSYAARPRQTLQIATAANTALRQAPQEWLLESVRYPTWERKAQAYFKFP